MLTNVLCFCVHPGTDDESSKMDEVWNDSQVVQVLRESRCVAIRLQANSEASAQFCQICILYNHKNMNTLWKGLI